MLKRPSDERLTLEERIAVVIAIAVAVGVHLLIFAAGGGIGHLVREEKKRERLMVIRRVREITPPPEIAMRVPDPRRVQVAADTVPAEKAGVAPAPPKPEVKVSKHGILPPPPKPEVTPEMEQDLQESKRKEAEEAPAEKPAAAQLSAEVGNSSVSVVTDLPSASFTLNGPAEYQGTGTFWIRRSLPPGTYRIIFSPVEGFGTPSPQTKDLPEKGQIVFVGKYKRSTEVAVETNVSSAQFAIYRPDGRSLDLSRPGRAFFDDLPPGTYTVVFKDVSGYLTPLPLSRTLSAGGSLIFTADYRETSGKRTVSDPSTDSTRVSYRGARVKPGGEGDGTGSGKGAGRGGPAEAMLDRRVQMVVSSTPKTRIEERYPPIAYPEVVIRKSNFQQGWCQVYLVVWVKAGGEVGEIVVERPSPENRRPYEALIKAVEESVRDWDYDKVRAEVHIDARFYVE